MTAVEGGWIVILVSMISANLPWLSDRIFFLRRPAAGQKRIWWRWAEWLVLYFIAGIVAMGIEKKLNGEIYAQGWEFYMVTFCLFLIFALPGFIYCHDLRRRLRRH